MNAKNIFYNQLIKSIDFIAQTIVILWFVLSSYIVSMFVPINHSLVKITGIFTLVSLFNLIFSIILYPFILGLIFDKMIKKGTILSNIYDRLFSNAVFLYGLFTFIGVLSLLIIHLAK